MKHLQIKKGYVIIALNVIDNYSVCGLWTVHHTMGDKRPELLKKKKAKTHVNQ